MRFGALNTSPKLLLVIILPSNIIDHSILMMLSLAVLLVLLLNGLLTRNLIRDKGCRTWMLIMLEGTILLEKQRT